MDFGHQRKEGSMDWVKELKEQVGVADEGFAADLNDVEGREYLTAQHLDLLSKQLIRKSRKMWMSPSLILRYNNDVTARQAVKAELLKGKAASVSESCRVRKIL